MKSKEEICKEAASIAREKTKKALARYKVTEGKVAKRLGEALDAIEIKVFLDKNTGTLVYSEPLIAHGPRLKAIEIATSLLEMKPAEKHDVNVSGSLEVRQLLEEIDKDHGYIPEHLRGALGGDKETV